ncbi:flagellar basal body L-ring protein FlgH [Phaeospirillum tilakii]|uniref:Flagellar L-ring protein n=1 Tax=Phaeospirillum tilakii TaxID=741673 RepID=A0ABW5CF33_9PROT
MTAASPLSRLLRLGLAATALVGLSACNLLTRMSEVGSGPETSRIENPTQKQGYQPITMPMPQPVAPPQAANSLWRPGARAFFKDQRAKDVGDILTVAVSINENADVESGLGNSRVATESEKIPALAGLEATLTKVLPAGADPANLASLSSSSTVTNAGKTTRTEKISMNLAATITQVLPNGNLVISGRQEFRVNYEMRELSIQGIIRPEDISSSNSISSEKIAEARIYYGGRGMVSDLAQPRWGQQIYDIVFPF